jgi:O-antigen/teichoic acid export membrane protein
VFAGIGALGAFSLATLLGYVAQSTFHYFNVFRRLSLNTENEGSENELGFKNYSDIGLKTIISNLYLSNQIIVTLIAGATAGGIFSVAYRLRNLIIVGFTSVSWSITNDLLINNTRESFKNALIKNRLTLTLNTFGILILMLFSREIITYVFGPEYEKSITVLRLLCVSQLLSVFQILITTFLMCGYHEKSLRKMVSVIVPVTLLFEGAGAVLDGARGAAIGTLLSSIVGAFIYTRQFWKLSSKTIIVKAVQP